jgi:GAF domain-containing protein
MFTSLRFHLNVLLGTMSVESAKPDAFSESDLTFLEIFARGIAFALKTLKLLQGPAI